MQQCSVVISYVDWKVSSDGPRPTDGDVSGSWARPGYEATMSLYAAVQCCHLLCRLEGLE